MPNPSDSRLRQVNDAPVRPDGRYVLYWMTAHRRLSWNAALDRAIARAKDLRKPLVLFEPLRIGYPWASDRFHRFIIDGMADHAGRLAGTPITYYPYVEPAPDADRGLLAALAADACLVVTDDYPAFFLPHMLAAAARHLAVRLEAVDANGLLPLQAADRTYPTAYAFRRFLQQVLPEHLLRLPEADPLAGLDLPTLDGLPATVPARWPAADLAALRRPGGLATLAIDHSVGTVDLPGGDTAAQERLGDFLRHRLADYGTGRNDPARAGSSGLSPYLHFGHIGAAGVLAAVARHVGWDPGGLAAKATGKRSGWWGMPEGAEAFLDQLVTWRELGYNACAHDPQGYDRYDALPEWARRTLAAHAADPRPLRYRLEAFAAAATHDPLWNAAQGELVRTGRMHNYLRMLWGKKILEWSASPQEALAVMIELNNRYALDGRDPNSYSGIFWTLGRYDRPWGPERPIFGTVRYMSSAATARKLDVRDYVARFGRA